MNRRFTVNRANEVPRERFLELRELTNSPSRGDFCDEENVPTSSALRIRIDDHISGEHTFTDGFYIVQAFELTKPVGWCLVQVDERVPVLGTTAAVGFYVHPKHRRRGIGEGLILEASAVARKYGMTKLMANPWNKVSRGFFSSCNFRQFNDSSRATYLHLT